MSTGEYVSTIIEDWFLPAALTLPSVVTAFTAPGEPTALYAEAAPDDIEPPYLVISPVGFPEEIGSIGRFLPPMGWIAIYDAAGWYSGVRPSNAVLAAMRDLDYLLTTGGGSTVVTPLGTFLLSTTASAELPPAPPAPARRSGSPKRGRIGKTYQCFVSRA